MSRLADRMQGGDVLVLDGPTGTELIARGFSVEGPGALWTAGAALRAPQLLLDVHASYVAAGADLITANTFRTTALAATSAGLSSAQAYGLCFQSVAIARIAARAAAPPVFVLGSMAPLADCYRPQDAPGEAVQKAEHERNAEWLAEAGCDGILVETQGAFGEAVIATRAAKKSGLPVLTSLLPVSVENAAGCALLDGADLLECARRCRDVGADAILVNCAHSEVLIAALRQLRPLAEAGVPLGAYPNAARMTLAFFDRTPTWQDDAPFLRGDVAAQAELLCTAGREFLRLGARIVGACCGFSPKHIAALAAALGNGQTGLR